MLAPANMLRLLSEVIFVLLGLLLLWVAWSGRIHWDRQSVVWIVLGAFLVFRGGRAWWMAGAAKSSAAAQSATVRGVTLALVGVLMLAIAWAPLGWIPPLLAAAGVTLVTRGIFSSIVVLRGA
jgi:hypothetical protein